MTKFLLKTLLGVIAIFTVSMSAMAEGKQNFALINKTGYTISEVYVAPSKSDTWDEDIMGPDQIADGDRVDIEFSRKEKTCKWDLRVVYEDEDEATWEGFNLCEVSVVTIFYDRKKDTTWAEYE